MKLKNAFYGMVLAVIMFAPVASAQTHDSSKETCNQNLNGGFNGKTGSGKNGAFTVRTIFTSHYKQPDGGVLAAVFPEFTIDRLNQRAAESKYSVKFEQLDADSKATADFTIYFDVYNNDGSFKAVADVHGGVSGHLFLASTSDSVSTTAFENALNKTADNIASGWMCATK
jgi:hypothetical protein